MSSETKESAPVRVSGAEDRPDPVIRAEDSASVPLYMFRLRHSGLSSKLRSHRTLLFLSPTALESCASADGNRARRLIRRMIRNRNGLVRWFGRVSRSAYRYYQKLEDQIDPLERMVKALNAPDALEVWHAHDSRPESHFRDFLRLQVVKHTTWLVVDACVTGVAILLMPIPGPNVLGWYPFLRSLSHFRALKGARRVLGGLPVTFRDLPELAILEDRVRPGIESTVTETGLKIEGLDKFLKRVG